MVSLQTEIIRSLERDKVARVEVFCPLEARVSQPLRDHVLGVRSQRQFYLLGSLVVVTQFPGGFGFKTRGQILDDASVEQLASAMQERAAELYNELERLRSLGNDVKLVFRLGLGPDLGIERIADHDGRLTALEHLAQDAAEEDVEPPYESVQERLDPGFGEDLPSEGDPCPHPHGLGEPPPAEPDYLQPPGRSLDEVAQELVIRFMDVFNRCGRFALVATFAGLAVAVILRAVGVF